VKKVVIVGAGIAGLSAAYRLMRAGMPDNAALELVVYEASGRVGGVIETATNDGFVMERGPDSIITEKPWALDLCREVGIADRVVPTRREHARSLIVRNGRLLPVPDGLHLMAPSKMLPFALSPAISLAGKLRMAADLVIPRRRDGADESLADFVRRRLGREALERLAQPMVGGVYTADPEKLSLLATMPRFVEMERDHGSVIRAMLRARRSKEQALGAAAGPRYELFVSLREGLEELPRKLRSLLPAHSLRLDTPVTGVEAEGGRWRVTTPAGSELADALCLATPAHRAATLLDPVDHELALELAAIEHASSATVNLAYRRSEVGDPLEAFGFVVPAIEQLPIIACTYTSQKYAERSESEHVLLRAFVGGALFPDELDRSDSDIAVRAHDALSRLLGIRGQPVSQMVSRYPRSMPQYHVGHAARVERIDRRLARHPGLALAGNAYRGTGIPDCVLSGNRAAERLIDSLS
jgi:oxygen-dependent protoporphyrinogen oxidase